MDAIKKILLGESILSFERLGMEYLVSTQPHLVMGYGDRRHLKIAENFARKFPDSQIVYWDNSGGSHMPSCCSSPRNGDLPGNIHFTSRPAGKFGTVDFMWTLHSLENPSEKVREVAEKWLYPKGRVGLVDYVLGWARDLPEVERIKTFKKVFATSLSEKKSLKEEGDEACFRNHTQYTLESMNQLFLSSGFRIINQEVEYVEVNGVERPKTLVAFYEKVSPEIISPESVQSV